MYAGAALPELKKRYIDTGQVYYVYKDFPIVELHPQATLAAQAAECAGEQDKYWDMHNALFANAEAWDTTQEAARAGFRSYAEAIGMDVAAFERCISEGTYADEVQRDYEEARSLGLQGTPAFIINGKLLSGARPIEQFVQVLDQELANQ